MIEAETKVKQASIILWAIHGIYKDRLHSNFDYTYEIIGEIYDDMVIYMAD